MSKEEGAILVVDDDETFRGNLVEILDYRFDSPWIETASSAEEALKVFDEVIDKDKNISLIISDVWLPGMSGLKLFSKIRRKFPDISFILMSGDRGVEREVKKIGAKFFIPKPFWHKDLIELVKKAWKSR